MTIHRSLQLEILVFNDSSYDPGSVDNTRLYNNVYGDKNAGEYVYKTKHALVIAENGEPVNAAMIIGRGGAKRKSQKCNTNTISYEVLPVDFLYLFEMLF